MVKVKVKLGDIKSKKDIRSKTNDYLISKNEIRLSLINDGFDYDKGYIVISRDNFIIDGFYRHNVMCELYDLEYEITVKKKIFNFNFYKKINLLFVLLISPKKFNRIIKDEIK